MKKALVMTIWAAVAIVGGLIAAQVVYMCGAPLWAVALAFLLVGVVVFGFGMLFVGN